MPRNMQAVDGEGASDNIGGQTEGQWDDVTLKCSLPSLEATVGLLIAVAELAGTCRYCLSGTCP